MGLSTNTYEYSGGDQTFPINFADGFIERSHVSVFRRGDYDGLGNQVLLNFEWLSDSEVRVLDTLTTGDLITTERTVPKTEQLVDLEAAGALTREGISRNARQALHAVHEVIDARIDPTAGLGPGTVFNSVERFSGGQVFELAREPISKLNTMVFIDGVYQDKTTYSLLGNVLTLSDPTGGIVEVVSQEAVSVGSITVSADEVVTSGGKTLQEVADESVTLTGAQTVFDKTMVSPSVTGPAQQEVMRAYDDRIAVRMPFSFNNNFLSMWTFGSRAEFIATSVPGWLRTWTIMQNGRPVRYRRDDAAALPAIASTNGAKGVPEAEFTPLHWGAVGDGVADDGAAFNAALAAYKVAVEAVSNQAGALVFTGLGLQYRTTVSLNFTGVSTWGSNLRDMTIFGDCAGKAVLDCIGSRGGTMRHVLIVGSASSMPSVGIQFARSSAGGQEGFCDNWQLEDVHARGHFSVAGGYFYGQETTTYSHCSFWNSHYDGHAALHTGYDIYPMLSDYLPAITGGTSYINDKYINCDYRYYPAGKSFGVAGITKANPAVFNVPGHTFSVGDRVAVGYIGGGMVEANGTTGVITAVTGADITLGGVDSTGWTTYTTGGVMVLAQTKATVVFSRGSQHVFDCCYTVNYGSNHIEFAFPDGFTPLDIRFDMLCEGTGNTSCIRFTPGTSARAVRGFEFRTYAVHTNDGVVSTDASGAGSVTLSDVRVVALNTSNAETPMIFVPENKFALVGGHVTAYSASAIDTANFIQFRASVQSIDALAFKHVNVGLAASELGFVSGRGVGGVATQLTSKTTGVTLNKRTGLITMHDAALPSLSAATFRLLNSTIGATSMVVVNVASGASTYRSEVIRTSPGLCDIRVTNLSGGTLSDAVQLRYAVLDGAEN